MTPLRIALPWIAAALAAVAAAGGLFAAVYRDVPAMVDQARAADLATLFVAVPLLCISHARGARLIAAATLAYLVYTYAIFSFEIVLNPMSPLYIATLSVSVWALVLGVGDVVRERDTSRPLRLVTSAFLGVVALMFTALWSSEIAGSIASGSLPSGVAELNVPTSAVYALDLGFVLPLFLLAGVLLIRRSPWGAPMAIGSLVFLVLMALSILPMFAIQAARGEPYDLAVAAIFAVIGGVAATLAAIGLLRRRPSSVARAGAAVPL